MGTRRASGLFKQSDSMAANSKNPVPMALIVGFPRNSLPGEMVKSEKA